MTVYLLDSNVLIALATPDHMHHQRAHAWFRQGHRFATCPITQGALIRFLMRNAERPSINAAKQLVAKIEAISRHEFWPDTIAYSAITEKGVTGHRQVTDAYLVALAAAHKGVLVTLDEGIAAIHSGCHLI